jgi:hypothetical protein
VKQTILLFFLFLLAACATKYPNQQPVGQPFPVVQGENLAGENVYIPKDMNGKPTVLLVAYKHDSQFDVDRWLIGLDMTNTQIGVFEIPTLQGMFPRMFSTFIDEGMRKGIPKELWQGVVTIYENGEDIQAFTGNTNPKNSRVVLIDKNGIVRYFHDEGFSVPALNRLRVEINKLK